MSNPVAQLTQTLSDRYRIDRELGAGGMATVYLAHDIKHDRDVAIKVLKPELGAVLGAERFLSEITVTANLQHPNLLPLFDSGEAGGLLYYVMPYIEGETLRATLQREPQLSVDETLRLVTLMAGALDFAHARGVVHRDLKPENILLQAGQPVIADFGIALAVSQAGGERITQTGLSLGTPHYMSPEQAAGDRTVDARSDQYALGALTYEMLMGEPPHTGPTAQMIIARVMSEVPRSIHAARPGVPSRTDAAVHRALSKTPADRFASCGDFARAMADTATDRDAEGSRSRFGVKPWVAAVVGAGAIATAVAAFMLMQRTASEPLPVIGRTTQVTRDPGLEVDPALSRDGAMIAYAQGTATHMQIYVQQVNGGRRIALTNDSTNNFRSPVWSPDNTQIAYQGNDGIYVVSSLGGTARRVAKPDSTVPAFFNQMAATTFFGVAWSPDGTRLAYLDGRGVTVVAMASNESVLVPVSVQSASPSWSPDGRYIAVSVGNPMFNWGTGYLGNMGFASIWIVPLNGDASIQFTDDRSQNISPKWAPDGKALYWISDRDGSNDIFRAQVSSQGLPSSPPTRLTTGVSAHSIDLSADGTRLAYSSFREYSNIWALPVPRAGPVAIATARAVTTGNQIIEMLDVSADGTTLVFDSDQRGNGDIYRMPSTGGDAVLLTTDSAGDYGPRWSPDGRHIAFHSLRAGSRDIYTMNADGSGVLRRTSAPTWELDVQWSPDGLLLAFEVLADSVGSAPTFWTVALTGAESTWRALGGVGDFLAWSRTGIMAYHAADGMRTIPRAGEPARLIVDNALDGGTVSLGIWSPDGATLYYLSRRSTGWEIRATSPIGGPSRPLVTFDDPARQPTRYGFATDGRMFYLTLGSRESDITVMTLEKR